MSEWFDDIQFTGHLPGSEFARSVDWSADRDDQQTLRKIAGLATLTARIRSETTVWTSDPSNDAGDIDFTTPIKEGPMRLMSVLLNLARGHALATGRSGIDESDLPLVAAVALSSMPDDRRKVLDLVIDREHPDKESNPGSVTSTEVVDLLHFSKPTSLKVLRTLAVLEIGNLSGGSGQSPLTLKLKSCYSWLTTAEFQSIRDSWRDLDTSFPGAAD